MSAGAPSIGEEPTQRTEGHPVGTAARPPVLGFIGLGEAGFHIARGLREAGLPGICAFDRYWNVAPQSELVLARAREAGVELQPSLQALVEHCDIVVSAVSATLSVPLAKESAPFLRAGQLFADLNSAGPQTKVEAAAAIAGTGAAYVDGAIMGTVPGLAHRVPTLLCGDGAQRLADALGPYGMQLTVLDGPVTSIFRTVAETQGLPLITTSEVERPFLESGLEGDAYLKSTLSKHHLGEYRRLKRRLGEQGKLVHSVARGPEDIRPAIEGFLALEAAGWKGRKRTAMATDRYRAAFAREAVHGLAERDLCRIHSLTLDGKLIASLIVFVEAGVGYTWKTAYDEAYAAFSPGVLLMIEVTRQHLEDPNIERTDSCAVPDHPMVSRLWSERRPMGTLMIGTTPAADRITRQAASQLHFYRETRNFVRLVHSRVRGLLRRR